MIADKETRLATNYERIRRREYELINDLLEVMPRIDGLKEDRVTQMRDALFHADHPYLMVFVGPFSSGKSSLINALLGSDSLLQVGPTPTTDRITMLRHGDETQQVRSGELDTVFHPSPLLEKVSFVDTPGLESIFREHEATTRRFLHRSDAVIMVMLATQAMTRQNLEYLQLLKEYGKTVIIVINQVDLLSAQEADSVREYVLEQSQDHLGYKPRVWLMSARHGLAARQPDGSVDPALWEASGLSQLEHYVDEQLSDKARLRQKLETPLQIVQNAHQAALAAVRDNQAALDAYAGIAANVEAQLTAYKREQDKAVRDVTDEVRLRFTESADRGAHAIRSFFRLPDAPRSVIRGLGELIGVAGILRSGRGSLYARPVLDERKVYEPLLSLPDAVNKLAPRLEGKDIQDTEALVSYARKEIDALPPTIREKVIGDVKPPMTYDRTALQEVRTELENIEDDAKILETERLEQMFRNTLLYLGGWIVLMLIFVVFVLIWNPISADGTPLAIAIIPLLLLLGAAGALTLPLRGRWLALSYQNRMAKLATRYIEVLTRAADKQVDYGMRLRRDTVSPLTRLIEAQTSIQSEQLSRLQTAQQNMVTIERELTEMLR